MALKEKALKRLAEKLNQAGLVWAVGGDWARFQRGQMTQYHTFDIAAENPAAADAILTRLGMRHLEEVSSGLLASYHFDGADIRLSSEALRPEAVAETVTVLGQAVPLMAAEDVRREG